MKILNKKYLVNSEYIENIKPFIKKILENPLGYEWSLQGFGMLRLYINNNLRLHIWNDNFSVKNVSLAHDHPWDFTSYIISGEIENIKYVKILENLDKYPYYSKYNTQKIKCGPEGCAKSDIYECVLLEKYREIIKSGESYYQSKNEIHMSFPKNGTVSLIDRKFYDDTEHANVFWNENNNWVEANPVKANEYEVEEIISFALKNWSD